MTENHHPTSNPIHDENAHPGATFEGNLFDPSATFRPLASFTPRGGVVQTAVIDGEQVVVLDHWLEDPDYVNVYSQHGFTHVPAHTPAHALENWAEDLPLLKQFAATVIKDTAAPSRETADAAHTTIMAEVRGFTVELHRRNLIGLDELNEFFDRIDQDPYRRRMTVQFAVHGAYSVSGTSCQDAHNDAEHHLSVDLDSLDDLIPDSDSWTVNVLRIEVEND